jgi:hypothetical protein
MVDWAESMLVMLLAINNEIHTKKERERERRTVQQLCTTMYASACTMRHLEICDWNQMRIYQICELTIRIVGGMNDR